MGHKYIYKSQFLDFPSQPMNQRAFKKNMKGVHIESGDSPLYSISPFASCKNNVARSLALLCSALFVCFSSSAMYTMKRKKKWKKKKSKKKQIIVYPLGTAKKNNANAPIAMQTR